VIDTSVHHDWSQQEEIAAYLPRAWRELVEQVSHVPGRESMLRLLDVDVPFRNPNGAVHAGEAPGAKGITDPEQLKGRDLAGSVLAYGGAAGISLHGDTALGVAVCAAMNDWTADRWLGADDKTWGSIIVPTQLPLEAAKEIRRHGSNLRMAQILIAGNGLGEPFGHPLYHDIYRAAAEYELPIAIPIGTEASAFSKTFQTAVAPPATYTEYRILAVQAFMTHVISLVGQGVFEEFPRLKIMLVGGGIGWVPSTFWRHDACYQGFGTTAPWVRRRPSEYFREHFRLSTYQLESPEAVLATSESFPGIEDMLCFASGFPRSDSQTVEQVLALVPADWAAKVTSENALAFYGDRISSRALAGGGAQ
jgi:predicted TIM-barrel fold metal-dependent hydrolase